MTVGTVAVMATSGSRNAGMVTTSQPTPPSQGERGDKLYLLKEVCRILRVSRATLYRLMNSGALHYSKVGGQRRISRRQLDECIDRHDTSRHDTAA